MNGTCPVPSCKATVGRGYLMCLEHWRLVPKTLQRQVWKGWRALVNRRDIKDRLAARGEYREARDQAIAAAARAEYRALPIVPDEPRA